MLYIVQTGRLWIRSQLRRHQDQDDEQHCGDTTVHGEQQAAERVGARCGFNLSYVVPSMVVVS